MESLRFLRRYHFFCLSCHSPQSDLVPVLCALVGENHAMRAGLLVASRGGPRRSQRFTVARVAKPSWPRLNGTHFRLPDFCNLFPEDIGSRGPHFFFCRTTRFGSRQTKESNHSFGRWERASCILASSTSTVVAPSARTNTPANSRRPVPPPETRC